MSHGDLRIGVVGYDFAQGARVQTVCEAMEHSAAEGRWVQVNEIEGTSVPA